MDISSETLYLCVLLFLFSSSIPINQLWSELPLSEEDLLRSRLKSVLLHAVTQFSPKGSCPHVERGYFQNMHPCIDHSKTLCCTPFIRHAAILQTCFYIIKISSF